MGCRSGAVFSHHAAAVCAKKPPVHVAGGRAVTGAFSVAGATDFDAELVEKMPGKKKNTTTAVLPLPLVFPAH